MATLSLVACSLVVLFAGAAVANALYQDRAERLAVTLFAAIAIVIAPIHVLAWLSAVSRASLIGSVVGLSIVLTVALHAAGWRLRATLTTALDIVRLPLDAIVRAWRARHIAGLGLLAFIAIVGWTSWLAYLAPSTVWDGLWYHEAIVGYSLELGGMADAVVQSRHQYVNGYPRFGEYLQLWMVVAGEREWIDGATAFMGVALLSATYLVVRRFARSPLDALGYALAMVMMPGVVLQFRSTLIDVTVAAFAAASMWLAIRPVLRARDIVAASFVLGMLAGTKASGAFLAALYGVVIAARVVAEAARQRTWRTAVPALAAAAIIGLALGAPSYVRNFELHGNPIWPMAFEHEGLGIAFEGKDHATPKDKPWSEVAKSLISLPEPGKEPPDTRDNGYGNVIPFTVLPLAVLGALAALAMALLRLLRRQPASPEAHGVLILVATGVIAGAVLPAIWWARLHLHLVIVALAACAWLLRKESWAIPNGLVISALVIGQLYTLTQSTPGWGIDAQKALALSGMKRSERRVLDLGAAGRLPTAIAKALEAEVGSGDLVTTDGHYLFLANLWNKSFSNRVRFEDCPDGGELSALSLRSNAKWVFATRKPCVKDMDASPELWERVGRVNRDTVVFRRRQDAQRQPTTKTVLPALAVDCSGEVAPQAYQPPRVTSADGFREPATEGESRLAAGPILGAVTDHSVLVWIRSDRPTPWRVVIWPEREGAAKRTLEGPESKLEHDLTATLQIDQLMPSTAYQYKVELGVRGRAVALPPKSFRTLPPAGAPGKVRVAVGGDIAGEDTQPIFAQIEATKPDLMLFVGDQIYADKLKSNFPEFAKKYERNWNTTELRVLMQSVPTFMMWDDHEIEDNYFRGAADARYKPARLAYELYVHAHNPAPVRAGELHYQFQAADISFFVLDVRTHRSNPKLDDGPGKTMLGAEQKEDLARFLKCAPGKLKVVMTPVVLSTHARGNDSWNEYAAEREQILELIEREKIDNVIVISGDQHWSALFLHDRPRTRFYEFLATPLSKSVGKAPRHETPEIVARDDDHYVFGVVDFDTTVTPATIAFTLCARGMPCEPGAEPAPTTGLDREGAQENVPFTVKITEDDIGPKDVAR
jgi:alkaline phosphatase D